MIIEETEEEKKAREEARKMWEEQARIDKEFRKKQAKKEAVYYVISAIVLVILFVFEDLRNGLFWCFGMGYIAVGYALRYGFIVWIVISIIIAIYNKVTGNLSSSRGGHGGETIGWPDRSDR